MRLAGPFLLFAACIAASVVQLTARLCAGETTNSRATASNTAVAGVPIFEQRRMFSLIPLRRAQLNFERPRATVSLVQ